MKLYEYTFVVASTVPPGANSFESPPLVLRAGALRVGGGEVVVLGTRMEGRLLQNSVSTPSRS